MSIKEKNMLKRNLRAFVIIIAVYVVIQIVITMATGNIFKDYLFHWDFEEQYNQLEPEDLELTFDEDGFVSLEEVTKKDGYIMYSLHPEQAGMVGMTVTNRNNGEKLANTAFRISRTGVITDLNTDNFTNFRLYQMNMLLLSLAMSILLWFSFAYALKELRFSYQSMFYSGLALWVTLITILECRTFLSDELMVDTYTVLQTAATTFMFYTAPLMLIFCIALSISNISLIRHEGFRIRNVLGIILSVIMIAGDLLDFFILSNFSGSEMQYRIYSAVTGIYSSFYAFMECFLIGAILCGSLAAKHEPKPDMDYLIILGCKVKPDGTLYPLIRGRVDRAIAFYKKQLQKTGKQAIFVPSGGQGGDETISEAEAMQRYLLEQGIPAEQIMPENQSKNTVQNMQFSMKLIRERTPEAKVAFSTTNYHVFRSGIIARQNNFELDGMGSKTKWYFWPNAYMREVIGMMAYKWKSILIVMAPIVLFLIVVQFV